MDVLAPDKKLNFPKSVVEMMQGHARLPRRRLAEGAAEDHPRFRRRQADQRPARRKAAARSISPRRKRSWQKRLGHEPRDVDVLSYVMYPQVYLDYDKHVAQVRQHQRHPHARLLLRPAKRRRNPVEIEPGKTLIIRYLTTGEPHEDGTRTVFFELNGQPREVNVPDRSLEGNLHKHPKADPDDPDHVAAPMPGKVSTVAVTKGQAVKEGERLLSIEAMKMETAVYSPRDAKVA